MGLQHHTARLVRIPVLSVVLIMEESRGDSPLAGSPALVEGSMEVEGSTEAAAFTEVAVTGNSVQVPPMQTNDMENVLMRTKHMKLETRKVRLAWAVVSAALLLPAVSYAAASFAQEQQPKTFSSPVEASNALFQAAQNEDEQSLEAILGAGKEVTSSSDEVEDRLEREQFSQKYQEMHRLVREPDGSTVLLYIGAENWPFPVPLVSKNGAWYFDSKTGMQEIRFRRIGENEATAIQVCNAFALAMKQGGTRATSDDDSISQYAQGLVTAGTTRTDTNESSPYHGYYFRIVSGNSAAGMNRYVSGGKKRGGLALVAYPAEYRSSGVVTFVVNRGDVVHEKDLGPDTATLAKKLGAGDSSANWPAAE